MEKDWGKKENGEPTKAEKCKELLEEFVWFENEEEGKN